MEGELFQARGMTAVIGMKGRGQGIARISPHRMIEVNENNSLPVAIENPIKVQLVKFQTEPLPLFYVTCSRAEKSLAIVAYSNDPERLKQNVVTQGWFAENETELLAS